MNQALCWFRLPDGRLSALGHGDFIGRVYSAALVMDDPRVSEGHAMISLRGGEFWLLALRRRFAVDGKSMAELRLRAGQKIELVEGLFLSVESIELPDEVLAVVAEGMPAVALPAVAALRGKPVASISSRYEPEAPCQVWTTGEGWKRTQDGNTVPLQAGDIFTVENIQFRVVWLPIAGSGPNATRMTGGVDPPLRVVVAFDTAQVQRGDNPPILFSGQNARILSELVALGGPAPWDVVAKEIWKEEGDEFALRRRWDVALARLRARLREGRIRVDLVRAVGTGQVELALRSGDVVEDKS